MIAVSEIKKLAVKNHTTEKNVVREYLQHLFLSFFYSHKGTDNFLFKGGTALRIIYNSPRFSEDLDFSGLKNGKIYEKIVEDVLISFSKEGIKCDIEESKITSGGWFSIVNFSIYNQKHSISNQISYRNDKFLKEVIMINSAYIPSYKIFSLDLKIMLEEKIRALLERKKARDIFDLYFILREHRLRKNLLLKNKTRNEIIKVLKNKNAKMVEKELQPLMPVSFKSVLDNLPQRTIKELV